MYYTLSFVLVEHYVRHEQTFVLIHVFVLLAYCLLSTLLVLTLTVCKLRNWFSIASIVPQSHFDNEEDRRIRLSS